MGRKRDGVALHGHDIATTHPVLLFPDGSGPGPRLVTRARRSCGFHDGAPLRLSHPGAAPGGYPGGPDQGVGRPPRHGRAMMGCGSAHGEHHDESFPGGDHIWALRSSAGHTPGAHDLGPRRRTARAAARRGDGPPGACRSSPRRPCRKRAEMPFFRSGTGRSGTRVCRCDPRGVSALGGAGGAALCGSVRVRVTLRRR